MALVLLPGDEQIDPSCVIHDPPFCLNAHSLEGHRGAISVVEFLENSDLLLSAGSDRIAFLWDLSKEELPAVLSFRGAETAYTDAQILEDRCEVALSSANGTIYLHSLADGHRIMRMQSTQHGKPVSTHCVTSLDTDVIAVGTGSGGISLFDLRLPTKKQCETLVLGRTINDAGPPILDVVSIDNKCVITASLDGACRKLDLRKSGERTAQVVAVHNGLCSGLAIGENGASVASIGEDGVRVSDCRPYTGNRMKPDRRTAGPRAQFEVHLPRLAWRDGAIVAGSADGILRVLDCDDLDLVSVHERRAAPITDVAIHPKLDVVASGGVDASLFLAPLGAKINDL